MRFMDARRLVIAGDVCLVTRSGYTGEDGFEISVAASKAEKLARLFLETACVELAGLGARDSLRTEAGLCLYGSDFDEKTTPIEAAVEWAIPKVRRRGGARAGGFPGADVVLQQLDDGPPRRRVGLRPQGRMPIRGGTSLFATLPATVLSARSHLVDSGLRSALPSPWVTYHPLSLWPARPCLRKCGAVAFLSMSPNCRSFHIATNASIGSNSIMLKFTGDHEWLRIDGDVAVVGITEHAQEQLGDLVFVELPASGKSFEKGAPAAVVESCKAASDVYAPISGQIVETNELIVADPTLVNSDPLGNGWFFKLKIADPSEIDSLMDEKTYKAQLELKV